MSDNRSLFIEEAITRAVKQLLTGRVNKLLGDMEIIVPLIEFSNYCGGYAAFSNTAVIPTVSIAACERTEKERIIRLDAYSITIAFSLPESPESELHCYAYSAVVCKALEENPTLGGVADRAVVTGKKYIPPKKPLCGQGWELILSVRVTVEEMC